MIVREKRKKRDFTYRLYEFNASCTCSTVIFLLSLLLALLAAPLVYCTYVVLNLITSTNKMTSSRSRYLFYYMFLVNVLLCR
jgi:hypothetical protein